MVDDPIIAQLYRDREAHAARYGHDLKRIVAALQKEERESKRVRLNPGPKLLSSRH